MNPQLLSAVIWLFISLGCGGGDSSTPSSPTPTPTAPTPVPTPVVNLLTNGSFEGGPAIPSNSSYTTLAGGSRAIPGWLVTGGSIDYIGTFHPPSDGQRAIDLDGAFSTGGISQTFTTTPGTRYLVTFDLSGNPEGAPRIKNLRVSVGGVTEDFSFDTTGQSRSNLRWQPASFTFVANGTSATLTFSSLSPAGNSWGAFVDHAAVTG